MDLEEFFSPSYVSDDDDYYTADEGDDSASSSPEARRVVVSHSDSLDPLTSLPLEIVFHIMEMGLTSRDVYSLRFVSRACHQLFTSPVVCGFALAKFFPRSPEMETFVKQRQQQQQLQDVFQTSGPGNDPFGACVRRARRWKAGISAKSTVLGTIMHESTSSDELAFDSNVDEGVIAYQIDRKTIAIRDITSEEPEVVINLAEVVGGCISHGGRGQFTNYPHYTMSINRGRLVVQGVPHGHFPLDQDVIRELKAMNVPTESHPMALISEIGTVFAVFSTEKHDRGRLLHRWVENGHPLNKGAHNEFYFLNDYNLHVQELRGYIYPNGRNGPGHRFTLDKKNLYPPAAFTFAADTRGEVFYLAWWCRTDGRTFVEVITIPKEVDGEWTTPQVIKRVGLRSQARQNSQYLRLGLPREHWSFDLNPGRRVDMCTARRGSPGHEWKQGEDYVRICIRGDFRVPQTSQASTLSEMAVVNVMFWDITARPSPLAPASISEFLGGRTWKLDKDEWPHESPYADENGNIDYEDAYPTPTYFTSNSSLHWSQMLNSLPAVPDGLDIDTLSPEDLAVYPVKSWLWQRSANDVSSPLSSSSSSSKVASAAAAVAERDRDLRRVLIIFGHDDLEFEVPGSFNGQSTRRGEYPQPGQEDKTFVPAGIKLIPRYRVTLRPSNPFTDPVPSSESSSVHADPEASADVILEPTKDFEKMITSYRTRKRHGVFITDPSDLEAALRHELEERKDPEFDTEEEWGCFHERAVFDWKGKKWWLAFRYSKVAGKIGTRIIAMSF